MRLVFVAGRLPDHDLSRMAVKEARPMGLADPGGLIHTLFDRSVVPRACRTTRGADQRSDIDRKGDLRRGWSVRAARRRLVRRAGCPRVKGR